MLRQMPIRAAAASPRRIVSALGFRPSSPFDTARSLTTGSAATTQSPTPPYPRTNKPISKATVTTRTPAATAPRQLTYLVERSGFNHIPVYNEARSGGTRKETKIRKVVGNAQDLKRDIINELEFKKDDVNVNPVTGHIVIKGFHGQKVATWLEARGF